MNGSDIFLNNLDKHINRTEDNTFNKLTLDEFVKKYDYVLLDELVFNSYRTGQRGEIRDYDSISVTEILSLIQDPAMEFVKRFYNDKLEESCKYGTKTHKQLEDYTNGKLLDSDNKLHKQFIRACIREGIIVEQTEQVFKCTYKSLPIVSGTLDTITNMGVLDYKTGKGNRSFMTVKYKIQLAAYIWLSGIKGAGCFYLNQKGYKLEMLTDSDLEYYTKIWLELLEYADDLYNQGLYKDLYINK